MKIKKLNKIGTIVIAATSLSAIVPTITSCSCSTKQDDKIKEEYFDIVDGEIKGFKSTVDKATLEEYCKDGVLRLPAAKSIAANAFNAEMLKDAPFASSIEIQKSTTKIGERAFYANTASSITFVGTGESQLVEIDDSAFAFCTNLTSFKIPKSLFVNSSIIQDSAFFGCSSLNSFDCTEFDGASAVTPQWSFGAFKGTNATGNVLFNGSEASSEAVKSNFALLWSRLVFAGMKPAWDECWNTTSSPWTTQVKTVPVEYLKISSTGELQGANEKIWPTTDTDFNAVVAPSTVTSLSASINADFFAKRKYITTWSFTNSTFSDIPTGSFSSLDSERTVELWLPSTVATIGENAFKSCKWNISFNSFNNITSIGASAFEGSVLTKFTFASGVTAVGNNAFANCANLKELDLTAWTAAPTWTGTNIFTDSGSTTSTSEYIVKIKTYTNVVDQWQLKEVQKTYLNTKGMTIDQKTGNTWVFDPTCQIEYDKLFNIDNSGVLSGWAKNSSNVELTKDQVATIFDEYNYGTTLTLPASVVSVADNAFYASSASKLPDCITKIAIDSGCTSIGANAFTAATKVTEVSIPNTVAEIGNSAFSGCTLLATIDLSTWTTYPAWTGTGIFTGCATQGTAKIQNITNQVDQWRFNNSVRDVLKNKGGISTWDTTHWQFDHEDTATLLNVTNNVVTGWSSGATTGLTDEEKLALAQDKNGGAIIIIPAEATSIAEDAFIKDTIVSTIPSTLPTVQFATSSSCQTIGKKAFYKAPITTLDMTNAASLTTIGEHAFSGTSLTSLTLTPSLTTVNAGAFFQTQLASLTLPVFTNTITFGAGVFANNANLTTIDLTAYTTLPTWVDDSLSLFDNIKSSGTIKVKSALSSTILTYMAKHSNSIAYYDEWTVTTA